MQVVHVCTPTLPTHTFMNTSCAHTPSKGCIHIHSLIFNTQTCTLIIGTFSLVIEHILPPPPPPPKQRMYTYTQRLHTYHFILDCRLHTILRYTPLFLYNRLQTYALTFTGCTDTPSFWTEVSKHWICALNPEHTHTYLHYSRNVHTDTSQVHKNPFIPEHRLHTNMVCTFYTITCKQ